MFDLPALPCRHPGGAAGPEVGDGADHRPAVLPQPGLVAAGEPVLPLRDRDVAVDVDLVLIQHLGRVRRLRTAVVGIGLPRVHRAVQAARLGARLGGRQRAGAERHQRLRALRVQQEQGGEHPGVAVPEHVTRVTRRHAAGAGAPGGAGRHVGEQVVEVGVHDALRGGVAVDRHVGCPQRMPGILVRVQQRVEALRARLHGQRKIGLRVAAPAFARDGDELGEAVATVLPHVHHHVQRESQAVANHARRDRMHALRQRHGHGFRHRRAVRGAAVEPQRELRGVAVVRQHLGGAGIPQRGAVRRGGRHRFEFQVVLVQLPVHFRIGDAGQREARLVRRPGVQRERQFHATVETWREGELAAGEMRRGLAHQREHLDIGGARAIAVGVARGERAVVHVQRLRVVPEVRGVQRRGVEPGAAVGAVIDAAPCGHDRGARHVAGRAIHEGGEIGRRVLGAARRGQRGGVAVAELSGEIAGPIGGAGLEHETGVGGGERRRGRQREQGRGDECAFHAGTPGTASKAIVSRACSLRNGTVPCQT